VAGRYANQVRSLMYLFDMLMHDHVKAEDAHENRNLKVYAVVRSYFWERERTKKEWKNFDSNDCTSKNGYECKGT
jgi:hypothetical protein